MRPDLIRQLQGDVFGSALGETVTIIPEDGAPAVEALAVWRSAGSVTGGADDAQFSQPADTFAFRRRDLVSRAALRRGAIIVRSNGERYRIDGSGELGSELHRVVVTQEPRR